MMVFDMHSLTTPEQAKRNRERDDQNKKLQAGIRTVRGNRSTEEAQGGTERRKAVRYEKGDG